MTRLLAVLLRVATVLFGASNGMAMLALGFLLGSLYGQPAIYSTAPRGSVQPVWHSPRPDFLGDWQGAGPGSGAAPTPPASSSLPAPASPSIVPAVGSNPARDLPGVASMPAHLEGLATWYDWHPGQAAAGPALRAALGPGWRGSRVTVAAGEAAVVVRLTDACACPGQRVIDLDRRSFAMLADPSVGVIRVTVTYGGVLPPPPDTSTAP